MGLDIVEFFMAVEDEFGITINDSEAEYINTPKQMALYVMSCLKIEECTPPAFCASQSQFYRLRSILMREFSLSRQKVRLETPIGEIFQDGNSKKEWNKLDKALDYSFPSSGFPCFVLPSLLYCFFLNLFFILLVINLCTEIKLGTVLIIYLLILFFIIPDEYSKKSWISATRSVTSIKTVRDLVHFVKPRTDFPERSGSFEFVLSRIIYIASDQFGVPEEEIRPDSHFVEDLGVC